MAFATSRAASPYALRASRSSADSGLLMLPAVASALWLGASIAGVSVEPVSRPWLYAATKSFTISIASLLLVANDSQAWTTACVVSDACRCDSRIRDVTDDAETDADTDARYAGAIAL